MRRRGRGGSARAELLLAAELCLCQTVAPPAAKYITPNKGQETEEGERGEQLTY